jgi:hypothetical protein
MLWWQITIWIILVTLCGIVVRSAGPVEKKGDRS